MANIKFEEILSQVKQKIENLNLKDKWSKFKLALDQIPVPKWLLVVITSISLVVTVVSFTSDDSKNVKENNLVVTNRQYNSNRQHNSNQQNNSKAQSDAADEYDVMLDEFMLKVERLKVLIYDAIDSDHPFAYTKQIETLAAECEKLEKQLNSAPLDSYQKLYKNEIKADLEDTLRRLTWN